MVKYRDYVDMVNDFLAKWPPAEKQQLVGSINELVGLMRQCGYPIIWVRQEFEPDLRDAFPTRRLATRENRHHGQRIRPGG